MKTSLKILISFLATLLIVMAGAWFYLKSQFSDEALTAQANQAISENLARKASVGNVSLTLWPPVSLELQDLIIENSPDTGFTHARPMFELKHALVRVNLLALLQKRIEVEDITADSPYFLQETNFLGATNLEGLMKETADSTTATPDTAAKADSESPISGISFERITIKNLVYEKLDRKENSSLTATGIGLEVRAELESAAKELRLDGDFSIEKMSFTNVFGTLVEDLKITGSQKSKFYLEAGKFEFTEVKAIAGLLPLTLTGYMDSLYTERFFFDLKIVSPEADLKAVLSLISKKMLKDIASAKTSGKFKFDMAILGTMTKTEIPGFAMNFDLSQGKVQYPQLPQPITGIDLHGKLTEAMFDLKSFRAALGSNTIDGALLVEDFERKKINLKLFTALNLDELTQFYPLEKGTTLSGKINSNVRVSALLSDMQTAKASGSTSFTNVNYNSPEMQTPLSKLSGTLNFSNERLEIKNLALALGQSDIQFDGYVEQYLRLAFSDSTQGKTPYFYASLRSKNLNLDELLPADTAAQTAQISTATPQKREQLPDINGKFEVEINALTVNQIQMKNAQGEVVLKDKILDLRGLKFLIFGGTAGMSGQINLTDINRPKFDLGISIQELSISKMMTEMPDLDEFAKIGKYLDANVSLKTDFSGKLNDTLGLDLPSFIADGNLGMKKGEMSGHPVQNKIASALNNDHLKKLSISNWTQGFEIKNGRMHVEDLSFTANDAEIQASGSQGLDKSVDYKVTMKLPTSAQTGIQQAIGKTGASLLTDKTGRVPVNLLVSGTFDSPKVSLDEKALVSNATSKLLNPLTEKVEEKKLEVKKAIEEKKSEVKETVKKKVNEEKKKLEEKAKKNLKKMFGF